MSGKRRKVIKTPTKVPQVPGALGKSPAPPAVPMTAAKASTGVLIKWK